MRYRTCFVLAATALAAATAAQAHQVWLEAADGQARLYYGEFNDNLRETSPGKLDRFGATPTLQASLGAKHTTLEGARTKDAFAYTVPGTADTLLTLATVPVMDRSQRNLSPLLWKPAARWIASPQRAVVPTAPLDLVPTGKPGQFQVYFQGAPLPKAKVQMVAPSGWAREASSAEDGTVNFFLPWKGQYVAEVKHTDKTSGDFNGSKYGEVGYLITLSFVLHEGVASPALPSAPASH